MDKTEGDMVHDTDEGNRKDVVRDRNSKDRKLWKQLVMALCVDRYDEDKQVIKENRKLWKQLVMAQQVGREYYRLNGLSLCRSPVGPTRINNCL